MVFTKEPHKKIARLLRFLTTDLSKLTADEVQDKLEQKYGVGVFLHKARVKGQQHEFEIYRRFNGNWLGLLCRVKVPIEKFKPEIDF